jgi:hypothetical protein
MQKIINKVNLFINENGCFDNNAIYAGIYIIKIRENPNEKWIPLYIGESKTMLKRCGEHLYNNSKNPLYFGLTENDLNNDNIELKFSVLESIDDNGKRKKREKELINQLKPKTQNSTNDRQLRGNIKLQTVQEALGK